MHANIWRHAALYLLASAVYAETTGTDVLRSYGRIPILFEENAGQAPAGTKFVARGPGYTTLLCNNDVSFHLKTGRSTHTELYFEWVGGSLNPRVAGQNPAITKSNYLLGNDPTRWKTGIANYQSVEYQQVYPGIDLVIHGNQRQLEYDWLVAPGVDPSRIAVRFRNIQRASLEPGGTLLLDTAGGQIRQPKPVVWQVARDGSRHYIEGGYALGRHNTVRFRLAPYDHTLGLVIDPTLVYATYFGGPYEGAASLALDATGAAYVAGFTEPETAGSFHAFIMKLNPAGDAIVYSSVFGGGDYDDYGSSIAVDQSGSAYITGRTFSSNFPTTTGALQTTFGNPSNHRAADAFVTKFSPDGASFVYSTYLGGSGGDFGDGIFVDASGAAYITGSTGSPNFSVTPGALQTSLAGMSNAFVAKLNAAGTNLVYSTYLGGKCLDEGHAITIDASGNAYFTGTTMSAEFPTTPGAIQTTLKSYPCSSQNGDVFVSKINSTGTSLLYSTLLGGTGDDQGNGIAIDSSGNAYIVGTTQSSDYPVVPGSYRTTSSGGIIDAFVSKLNPTGTALIYSTYLGGRFYDYGNAIALDAAGNAWVTGSTESNDFPVTAGAIQTLPGWPISGEPGENIFVTKLNSSGSALLYSTYVGGNAYDSGNSIALDSTNKIYVAGGSSSSNFPVTPGAVQKALSGTLDVQIFKLDPDASCPVSFSNNNLTTGSSASLLNVQVTIPPACNWFAQSLERWITIGQGSPARGSGTVQLQVDANTGPSRSASVQIAGQLLTVSQTANCTYILTPGSLSFHAVGGSGEFRVDAVLGCSSTASTGAAWIQLVGPNVTHNGGFAQDFSVQPNVSPTARQANIIVAGQTFTVTQEGGPPPLLSVTKTHTGNFRPAQLNLKFTITVSNASGSPPTTSRVDVTEQGSLDLQLVSMSGDGWNCNLNDCFRTDPLAGGNSYAPITVLMNVTANANNEQQITNYAAVTGGGAPTVAVNDVVFKYPASPPPLTRDFRGRGRSDALIYDPILGQEYTALSNADGSYQYVPNPFTPSFNILSTGDFNGDGKVDLVVYNSQTALAYIGMSNGDGTFSFQSLFWSPGYDFVETGDLNADGKMDFALYNSSTGTMYTAISNGDGTFAYKYTLISKNFTVLRLADFTGDGAADLFLYNAANGIAWLGIGDGSGGFAFQPLSISSGYSIVDVGDLNGDGKADIVLYNASNGNTATGISDGLGGFTFTPLLFSPGFTSVRLADYNGDGKADITVYNKNTGAAYFGVGSGSGAFTFQSLFWSGGYDTVVPQDVNGDGKMDIVLYNSATGTEYTGRSSGSAFVYTYSLWGPGKTLAR